MAGYRDDANDGQLASVAFGALHAAIFLVSLILLIALVFIIPSLPLAIAFMADSPRSDPQKTIRFIFVLQTLGILALCGILGSTVTWVFKIRLPVYVSAMAYGGWLIWALANGFV
ncbi:hypothetical protein [uncultured Sphingomonas sp.]|uniref:hypothetical protein n=1 Tax=uncultured Sphingomonas sp. TaxID=158754 RepID=UPI0035C9F4D0